MKIKDLKHDHSLTDLLKVLIFSIIMLAPMIAVAVKCAYVVVNKNANQSYYGETINQETYKPINSMDNNLLNKKLYFNVKNPVIAPQSSNGGNNKFIFIENLTVIANNTGKSTDNVKGIAFYIATGGNIINGWFLYDDNTLSGGWNTSSDLIITFDYKGNDLSNTTKQFLLDNNVFEEIKYNKYSYLDNVFYYAIDEMSDNQLFSWTQNTGIYTGVKAMTDNLEITTDVVAVLITYWTLLTVIYVIIDIVLKGFTLLTHMFQKESH